MRLSDQSYWTVCWKNDLRGFFFLIQKKRKSTNIYRSSNNNINAHKLNQKLSQSYVLFVANFIFLQCTYIIIFYFTYDIYK